MLSTVENPCLGAHGGGGGGGKVSNLPGRFWNGAKETYTHVLRRLVCVYLNNHIRETALCDPCFHVVFKLSCDILHRVFYIYLQYIYIYGSHPPNKIYIYIYIYIYILLGGWLPDKVYLMFSYCPRYRMCIVYVLLLCTNVYACFE